MYWRDSRNGVKNPLIIKPQEILHKTVAVIAGEKRIVILVPLLEQIEQVKEEWLFSGVDAEVVCGSPFGEKEIYLEGVKEFSNKDIPLIVMDCMGYSWEMTQKTGKLTDKPIILP